MNRFERLFGILLRLRTGQTVSASELAQAFEVSRRTIYRDVEILSASGVPVYAEHGRDGGFRLAEGYFLPPLMFSRDEAVVLLMSLTLLRSMPIKPLAGDIDRVTHKLLNALPDRLRKILAHAEQIIGIEPIPNDIFHPETGENIIESYADAAQEEQTIALFLKAILESSSVMVEYRAPQRSTTKTTQAHPLGLFLDRGRWYLVGNPLNTEELRTWRADRVVNIKPRAVVDHDPHDFDVRSLLERKWLANAMTFWREQAPVKIRMSQAQAERLQKDWYYRYAQFEDCDEGKVMMTIGEHESSLVFDLLRWLGPDAELIEPESWRDQLKRELEAMLALYTP